MSCTIQDLQEIVQTVEAPTLIVPPHLREMLMRSETRVLTESEIEEFQRFIKSRVAQGPVNEIIPGVLIGDNFAALNKDYLRKEGITHVLNVAQGPETGNVNTTSADYEGDAVKYLGLNIIDSSITNLGDHQKNINDFIDDALNSKGKVLVHCVLGMSRSPAVVASYLISCRDYSAKDTIRLMRQQRDILPNNGFLGYLCELDAKRDSK